MSHLFFRRSCPITARIRYYQTYKGMATTVKEALSNGKLYTDQEQYIFLKLPVSASREAFNLMAATSSSSSTSDLFRGIIFDKDEITMMIPTSEYHVFKKDKNEQDGTLLLPENVEVGSSPYRLITFDIVLDPNLIGFMHTVTKVLAEEKISVLPFAAYSRDHIFVQEKDFNTAMAALERLRDDSSTTDSTTPSSA